jgi:hypothetical protein
MDVNEILGIAVVGALLSVVIQHLKNVFGTDSTETKLLTVALSVAVGGAYFLLRQTVWWATIVGVLGAASTVYAFVLKG